jgi:hypothetical protein
LKRAGLQLVFLDEHLSFCPDQTCQQFGEVPGDLSQVDGLDAVTVRSKERIKIRQHGPQNIHMVFRSDVVDRDVSRTLIFDPTFSQFGPADPNSTGLGFPRVNSSRTSPLLKRIRATGDLLHHKTRSLIIANEICAYQAEVYPISGDFGDFGVFVI